jgi:DNA polymerase I
MPPKTEGILASQARAAGEGQTIASSRPRLFLVDTMGYIFRAFHALPRLSNREGRPTQAVYGMYAMLRKLLADYHPEYIAAVYDLDGPTFRHEEFADYKANRTEMPSELAEQLPHIRRLLEAMRIPVVAVQGYEADDVIGALAKQAGDQELDVFIITSDKDMLQLVGGAVRVINPMKDNRVYEAAQVVEQMGVSPGQIADLLALLGDAIDNIPGAPGIGDKGARELIQTYGSVEACFDHTMEVTRKTYRESLENNREQILMSKRLATIDGSAPVLLNLAELKRVEQDTALLRGLFRDMAFTTFLKELPTSEAERVESAPRDYATLSTENAVREFLGALPKHTSVAVAVISQSNVATPVEDDVEESTLQFPSIVNPSVPSVGTAPQVGISIGAGVARSIAPEAFGALRAWLADSTARKVIHDSKSARLVLAAKGVELDGVEHDTFLYSALLDATDSRQDLATVVERRLGVRPSKGSAEEAADFTGELLALLLPGMRESELENVYAALELPVAGILARMESAGILIDVEQLKKLSRRFEGEIEALRKEICRLTGFEFNVSSPKQLAEVLFEKLCLPMPRKRGKGKVVSTAVDVLEALAQTHEVPRKVLDYRQLTKLKSTYVDVLPALRNPVTGRIHTSFNQAGAATGRLSSQNPNLQNIPIRTELGREIRAAFIAQPGFVLLAADYSQIELRLLAHFSEDPLLLEAFRRGDDIHSLTASAVFAVAPDQLTDEHRRRAKAINYGVVYGISAFGLSQQTGVSQSEAQAYIDEYFRRYEGVCRFRDETLEQVRKTGIVRTLSGRMRCIPDINAKDITARRFAERTAVNTPLQGSAADLIKMAMIRVDEALRESDSAARMLLQVHDELVLEVPEEEVARISAMVREAMEHAYTLRVPLETSVFAGRNWRDMDDV